MDLGLFARVLWRHRIVACIGGVLAVVLAFLSIVRVGTAGISYRDKQEWVSYQTMLVTQPGFTEGALNPTGAQESRLTLLAVLYSQFVTADAVTHRVWPHGPHGERVDAAPLLTLPGSSAASALPIVSIAAFSEAPARAQDLAARTAATLASYIKVRQAKAHLPIRQRVVLSPIAQAKSNTPTLWQGRKKTLAIVIFMTVWIATIGLTFVLENLNPKLRPVKEEPPRSVSGVAS
jgi:hypothetical protein